MRILFLSSCQQHCRDSFFVRLQVRAFLGSRQYQSFPVHGDEIELFLYLWMIGGARQSKDMFAKLIKLVEERR
jgi:hypothetical protein